MKPISIKLFFVVITILSVLVSCSNGNDSTQSSFKSYTEIMHNHEGNQKESNQNICISQKLQRATLGAGCFWCVEAVFQKIDGVKSVISGYMGGHTLNPDYDSICSGTTGHAEVIDIYFNPSVISYNNILNQFWLAHDPTTLNRQGGDIGTQYRSVIFTYSEEQKKLAHESKESSQEQFKAPIVTEILPATIFYPAEDYHQDFFLKNASHPYCQIIIKPKLEKLNSVKK